jgi:hypothetical protein
MMFFSTARSNDIDDLRMRVEHLENIIADQQAIMDNIAMYVEADIATPWMEPAKRLVALIKAATRL